MERSIKLINFINDDTNSIPLNLSTEVLNDFTEVLTRNKQITEK